MTYKDLIKQKNASEKLSSRILYFNILLYLITFIFSTVPALLKDKNTFLLILIPILLFIPLISLVYAIPKSLTKRKKLYSEIREQFKDSPIEEHYVTTFPTIITRSPILKSIRLIFLSLFSIFFSFFFYDLILSNSIHIGFMSLLAGCSISYMLYLTFRYTNYELIFTNTHIIYNFRIAHPLDSISKHQFIKANKTGYFLDINTGLNFFRIFINEDKKEAIENKLKIFN